MNLATANAISSTGRYGTARPNSVNLHNNMPRTYLLLVIRKKKIFMRSNHLFQKLPSSPSFSPHLRFISLIWREPIAVETITSINLHEESTCENQDLCDVYASNSSCNVLLQSMEELLQQMEVDICIIHYT